MDVGVYCYGRSGILTYKTFYLRYVWKKKNYLQTILMRKEVSV